MPLRWNNSSAAETILIQIRRFARQNANGGVEISDIGMFETAMMALSEYVDFPDDVGVRARKRFVDEAVIEAVRDGDLSLQSVLTHAKMAVTAFLRLKTTRFVLLTQMSIRPSDCPRSIKIDNAVFTFSQSKPESFIQSTSADQYAASLRMPKNYAWVRVSASGRTAEAAADRIFDLLDYLRGLWNLFFNLHAGWRFSSGRTRPVNKILLGPIQTLHRPNGKLTQTGYWYDPDYFEPITPGHLHQRANILRKFAFDLRRRVRSHPLGSDIRNWIARYNRALDNRDLGNAFLRLWAVLEDVTLTGRGSHEITVRRAASLYHDPEYHRAVLDSLRMWRNRMVHRGEHTTDAEGMVFSLKRYVERGIQFPLLNRNLTRTKDDYTRLLDLPTDRAELRKRLAIHKWAFTQRSKW